MGSSVGHIPFIWRISSFYVFYLVITHHRFTSQSTFGSCGHLSLLFLSIHFKEHPIYTADNKIFLNFFTARVLLSLEWVIQLELWLSRLNIPMINKFFLLFIYFPMFMSLCLYFFAFVFVSRIDMRTRILLLYFVPLFNLNWIIIKFWFLAHFIFN